MQEPEKLSEFIRLFNEEKYFESHEVLEELWRKSFGKKKHFYQGLIQAAVALHHEKNRNARGSQNEYRLALQKLKEFPAGFSNINLKKFREDISAYFSSNSGRKRSPKIDTGAKN